jgi:hypothetical protein
MGVNGIKLSDPLFTAKDYFDDRTFYLQHDDNNDLALLSFNADKNRSGLDINDFSLSNTGRYTFTFKTWLKDYLMIEKEVVIEVYVFPPCNF